MSIKQASMDIPELRNLTDLGGFSLSDSNPFSASPAQAMLWGNETSNRFSQTFEIFTIANLEERANSIKEQIKKPFLSQLIKFSSDSLFTSSPPTRIFNPSKNVGSAVLPPRSIDAKTDEDDLVVPVTINTANTVDPTIYWNSNVAQREIAATTTSSPTIVDRIVGKPNVPFYYDPEYHVVDSQLIYMTYRDERNSVWVTAVDPLTGTPTSLGKGAFLGTTTTKFNANGPEFGLDAGGLSVFYTGLDSSGNPQIFKTDLDGDGTFVPQQLTFQGRNSRVIPSKNALDPEVRITYSSINSKGIETIVAAKENSADVKVNVPYSPGDGATEPKQWVPEKAAILTSLKDKNGFYQIARFDVETGKTALLTFKESFNKAYGKIYEAPEYDQRLLYAIRQDTSQIVVYLFNATTKVFNSLTTLTVPTQLGSPQDIFVDSIEAFSIQGKTYFAVSVGLRANISRPESEELWIMSLDQQQNPLNIKINSDQLDPGESVPDPFLDPEVVIPDPSGNRALVPYWTHGYPNELHTVEVTFPWGNV